MLVIEKEKRLKIIELSISLRKLKKNSKRENSKLNPKQVEGGNHKDKKRRN